MKVKVIKDLTVCPVGNNGQQLRYAIRQSLILHTDDANFHRGQRTQSRPTMASFLHDFLSQLTPSVHLVLVTLSCHIDLPIQESLYEYFSFELPKTLYLHFQGCCVHPYSNICSGHTLFL